MKRKINVEDKYGYLVVNGKYFVGDSKDGKTIFIQKPKKEILEKIKLVRKVAKALKDSLDPEKVLFESIMKLDKDEFMKLFNVVFNKKRKYKAKTREGACADMKIGNYILPIVE